MSTKKSPLQRVKEVFGSKDKLVEALLSLPEVVLDRREGEGKDEFKKRLQAAANTKLLKLHQTGKAVAEKWGGKEALVDALLSLEKRAKDGDYRRKLMEHTLGRVFDIYQSTERRTRRAQKQAA